MRIVNRDGLRRNLGEGPNRGIFGQNTGRRVEEAHLCHSHGRRAWGFGEIARRHHKERPPLFGQHRLSG